MLREARSSGQLATASTVDLQQLRHSDRFPVVLLGGGWHTASLQNPTPKAGPQSSVKIELGRRSFGGGNLP